MNLFDKLENFGYYAVRKSEVAKEKSPAASFCSFMLLLYRGEQTC